jgi:hypothetical protein
MTWSLSKAKPVRRGAPASKSVETFLANLEHPKKPEIMALRRMILEADPRITEQIKWNAPSFRTSEYFATFNLRAKNGVGIILHLGAKVRDTATTGIKIADPESLLEWLAKDRATVNFSDLNDLETKRDAFVRLIRQWIKYL